jgi:hypothetical protein
MALAALVPEKVCFIDFGQAPRRAYLVQTLKSALLSCCDMAERDEVPGAASSARGLPLPTVMEIDDEFFREAQRRA